MGGKEGCARNKVLQGATHYTLANRSNPWMKRGIVKEKEGVSDETSLKVIQVHTCTRESDASRSNNQGGRRWNLVFLKLGSEMGGLLLRHFVLINLLDPFLLFALAYVTKSQLHRQMFTIEHHVRMQWTILNHIALQSSSQTDYESSKPRGVNSGMKKFHWYFFHLSIFLCLFTSSLDDLCLRFLFLVVHSSSQLLTYDLTIFFLLTRNELKKWARA